MPSWYSSCLMSSFCETVHLTFYKLVYLLGYSGIVYFEYIQYPHLDIYDINRLNS